MVRWTKSNFLGLFLAWEPSKVERERDLNCAWAYPRLRTGKRAKVEANLLHVSSYRGLNIIHTERWTIDNRATVAEQGLETAIILRRIIVSVTWSDAHCIGSRRLCESGGYVRFFFPRMSSAFRQTAIAMEGYSRVLKIISRPKDD